jgi:hypothetical protein
MNSKIKEKPKVELILETAGEVFAEGRRSLNYPPSSKK